MIRHSLSLVTNLLGRAIRKLSKDNIYLLKNKLFACIQHKYIGIIAEYIVSRVRV